MDSTNSVSLKEFPKVRRESVEDAKPLLLNISGKGYEKLLEVAYRDFCGNLSYTVETLIKDKHAELFD